MRRYPHLPADPILNPDDGRGDPFGDEDKGGGAGVREPRRPTPSPHGGVRVLEERIKIGV